MFGGTSRLVPPRPIGGLPLPCVLVGLYPAAPNARPLTAPQLTSPASSRRGFSLSQALCASLAKAQYPAASHPLRSAAVNSCIQMKEAANRGRPAIEVIMAMRIKAICPNKHLLNATLSGMAGTSNLNIGAEIRLEGNCPTCGASPMRAPSGYYELGDDGVLKKTGDYRP
jgi:hypothetical protein